MPISTCIACGRVFGGVTGFDLHRQGAFLQSGEEGRGRFCADPVTLGMHQDAQGRWVRPAPDVA